MCRELFFNRYIACALCKKSINIYEDFYEEDIDELGYDIAFCSECSAKIEENAKRRKEEIEND